MNKATRTWKRNTQSNHSPAERILAGSPPEAKRLRDFSAVCSPAQLTGNIAWARASGMTFSCPLHLQYSLRVKTHAILPEKGGNTNEYNHPNTLAGQLIVDRKLT